MSLDWPLEVFDVLVDAGVRQVATVPDAGHARLIELVEHDERTRLVRLTTEEEGVALLAGAWLGGERGVLLMQSSGVGNCVNMLALPIAGSFPLLMIVTMRGDEGEFNPMQMPMGLATQSVLEAMGVVVRRARTAADVGPVVRDAMRLSANGYRQVAVLISQSVVGAKDFRALTQAASAA